MLTSDTARRNSSLWLGLICAVAAVLCNFLFFLRPPAQRAIPWLSLALAVVAIGLLVLGLRRLFTEPRGVGARILGSAIALVSLLLSAGAVFGFYSARAVPASADAPHIGQTVPTFTLADTNNRPVSLTEVLAGGPTDPSSATAPKAVLLIFYRGYW